MNNYRIIKLTKPMKEFGTFGAETKFNGAKEIYEWITDRYIERQIIEGHAYTGGLYAIVSVDDKGNYVATELVFELIEDRITSYRVPTSADELRLMEFYKVN